MAVRVSHGTFRAIIAIIVVLGCFVIGGANLYLNDAASIPDWAQITLGAVVGFYFAERAVAVGMHNGYDRARHELGEGAPRTRAGD